VNSVRERRENNSSSTSNDPEEEKGKPEPWSIEHGYFAVMGGLTVRVGKENGWILNEGCTLTPRGVLFLAHHGLLPEIRKRTIDCRGKVDSLAKGLVCFQAGWMVIQSIARKVSGLPITLLELNTLAHVLCAVIMYAAWWHKPQNANEALIVDIPLHIAACMSSHSIRRKFAPPNVKCCDACRTCDNQWKDLIPPNESRLPVIGYPHKNARLGLQDIETETKPDGVVMLLCRQSLGPFPVEYRYIEPWHLTQEEVDKLTIIFENGTAIPTSFFGPSAERCLTTSATDMEISGNVKRSSKTQSLVLLSLLNCLYGGIHATSWASHFPTHVEQIMWQISVCTLAGGGFALMAWNYVRIRIQGTVFGEDKVVVKLQLERVRCLGGLRIWSWWIMERDLQGWKNILLVESWGTIFTVLAGFSLVARIFLVLESFLSVRSLPAGSYSTVAWVNLLPHIG